MPEGRRPPAAAGGAPKGKVGWGERGKKGPGKGAHAEAGETGNERKAQKSTGKKSEKKQRFGGRKRICGVNEGLGNAFRRVTVKAEEVQWKGNF